MKSPRRHHLREGGFTLIEIIVAVGLYALVGVAFATIFDVSINTFKLSCWWSSCGATKTTGGVTDRQAGAKDLSSLEQQLGGDVSRAICVAWNNPAGSEQGLCPAPLPATCTTTATLCVSWAQLTSNTCHTAVYSGTGSVIGRKEYSNGSLINAGQTFTTDGVTTAVTVFPASTFSSSIVSVTLTSLGVKGIPPSGTIVLHPIATNPTSTVAPSPC